jgi:Family of unknown function (DUF6146)
MKQVMLFTILIVFISSSGIYGQKGKDKDKNRDKVVMKADTVKTDSIGYELIISDPGFESFLATKPSMNFLSQTYYETWNLMYVTEWNSRYYQQQRYGPLYENYIDYRPNINYGLELNYKLYYYFLFFEHSNNVVLVQRRN